LIQIQKIRHKKILISALDWGFGHTTRCASLIKKLLENNNDVIFAGNTNQCQFIAKEFPSIKTELIAGYNITLSSKKSTYLQLVFQLKSIVSAIKNENNWVDEFVENNKIDLIISDNRYGFRHKSIHSVFMGHQINIKAPLFQNSANKKLLKYINQFNSCWIVDDQKLNLAGDLSQPKGLTIPYQYTGLLSRFTVLKVEIKFDYLVIISGPKPENGLFLKEVENHFLDSSKRIAIVSTVKSKQEYQNLAYFYAPTTQQLNSLINESDTIISKAGYTTLMELSVLDKKAFLIPTKGQFEQEYLSKHIVNKKFVFIKKMSEISK